MRRTAFSPLAIFALIQLSLGITLPPPSLAQDWEVPRARGTLRVVDLFSPDVSVNLMFSHFLIRKDKDNKFVPSLAENWRWIDDRTIEFKLRRGVLFHNGEELDAEAVKIN